MGIKKSSIKSKASPPQGGGLADALFTKVQQRVLAVLFGHPDRSFYANELIALVGSGTGAVQRELARLASSGLVTVNPVGNQRHYQANAASPVYAELRGLVLKTSGLVDVLRAALLPLAAQIETAFVYGSVAKQQDTAGSDIDLMVVSDTLSYAEVFAALEEATTKLGRTVNPTMYSRKELDKRVRSDNAFIKRVWSQPRLPVIGLWMSSPLDALSGPGKSLRSEPPDAQEFAGLKRSGLARLQDASNPALSLEGRFDLAYNAAHALCLAALRAQGYRPANRYIVFQVLPHTLGLGPEVWRVLAKCHEVRNLGEYEGDLNIDDRLLADLLTAARAVAAALEQRNTLLATIFRETQC